MRKQLALLFGFLISINCFSQEIADFSSAWSYLIAPSKSEQWIVVSSDTKDGFFQCSNIGEAIRCSIPIWEKDIPGNKTALQFTNEQEKPHPDVKGSVLTLLLDKNKENLAKDLLKKYHLEFGYIYSQVKDENGNMVGTSCDLNFFLSLEYKNFELLAKNYLKTVYGFTDKDKYKFDAGTWE